MISLIITIIAVAAGIYFYRRRPKAKNDTTPANTKQLLTEHVAFYRSLGEADKALFESRVTDFLSRITITGVGVEVEELDRVLIGAGAIIPIFAFPDWKYNNIS